MNSKIDILILTATFGLGHISASKSIKEHIIENKREIKVDIVDVFEILYPRLHRGVYKGYELLIKKNSKLYNYFYYKKRDCESFQVGDIILKIYLPKFANYIMERQPKVIISTFPISSSLVSKFKSVYQYNIPLITCITDVVDSKEWIYPNTDKYFVATKVLKEKLARKGISKEKIDITGIPVRKGFLYRNIASETKKYYDIKENDFVIMIMGGGMGILPEEIDFYKWLNSLKNVKTLVLTGKNLELYTKLKEYKKLNNLRILKYTDDVSPLMHISDILISKAGGVTLYESIASNLPIIVYSPKLGQEIENAKFILDKGIGNIAQGLTGLKENIDKILKNKNYLYRMHENISMLSKEINMELMTKSIIEIYNSSNIYDYINSDNNRVYQIC